MFNNTDNVLHTASNKFGVKYIHKTDGTIIQKQCTNCGEMHKIEKFPKKKGGFADTDPMCKACKYTKNSFRKLVNQLHDKIKNVSEMD